MLDTRDGDPICDARVGRRRLVTSVHLFADANLVTAIQAVDDMVKAPDFDRKMLYLATQLSHECDMKALLLSVLEALLKTMAIGDKADTLINGMTLIRCIIRLLLKLLNDKAADR
jgi:hypothetical protein